VSDFPTKTVVFIRYYKTNRNILAKGCKTHALQGLCGYDIMSNNHPAAVEKQNAAGYNKTGGIEV